MTSLHCLVEVLPRPVSILVFAVLQESDAGGAFQRRLSRAQRMRICQGLAADVRHVINRIWEITIKFATHLDTAFLE